MSEKLLSHRAALCNMVRRIANDAGSLILEYYDGIQDMSHDFKADGSPVTKADQEAEKLIVKALRTILPNIPVIGEEGAAEGVGANLSDHDYFWLVDPLDGTRNFVQGGKDFTVNIGLIYMQKPVLGVVYAPERGEMYAGFTEQDGKTRAYRYFEDSDVEKDMFVRTPPSEGLTIMTSSDSPVGSRLEAFLQDYKVAKIQRRASSLKICAIANGKADLYPRLGKTCEWDTAAGDAILRAAGGIIKDLDGNEFVYGRGNPNFENPEFIAASTEIFI